MDSARKPVGWGLSLDAGDNDPARFWRHAAAALDRVCPGIGKRVGHLLVVALVLSALPGAILGVPLGFGRFTAVVHGACLPPVTWLVVTVLGMLVAMTARTVVPARIGARQPVAEVVQSGAV